MHVQLNDFSQWQREKAFLFDQQLAHCTVIGDDGRDDAESTPCLCDGCLEVCG
jgi:hypothetical protein